MDLKDIASISGKSGLFKVVKPTRTGVILETIDVQKLKVIANANDRVSLLKEISVYTTGKESSLPLETIFEKMHDSLGTDIKVDSKSAPQELSSFLEKIIPEYDKEKVYLSDIKKIVSWYATLIKFFPERFVKEQAKVEKIPAETLETVDAETPTETKKPKAKKAPAKKKAE